MFQIEIELEDVEVMGPGPIGNLIIRVNGRIVKEEDVEEARYDMSALYRMGWRAG